MSSNLGKYKKHARFKLGMPSYPILSNVLLLCVKREICMNMVTMLLILIPFRKPGAECSRFILQH